MQLTTSFQPVKSYTWTYSSNFQVVFTLYARYTTQSITNNNSTVETYLYSDVTSGSGSGSGYNFTCTYCNQVSGSGIWYFADETITSGGSVVPHNSDGTASITLTASMYNGYLGLNTTMSETVTLPPIARTSTLSSFSFTITNDNNITCTPIIDKKNSSFYDILTIKNGSTTLFTQSGVTNNTSFSLDATQRTALLNAIGTETSRALNGYITTYTSSGGSLVGTSSAVTCYATLPDYSITATISDYEDTGSYTSYYTSSKIVDYLSKPKLTFSYSSSTGYYYGRTATHGITYVSNTNEEKTVTTASPVTITDYGTPKDTTNILVVSVTDGRKSSTANLKDYPLTRVAYTLPTITTASVTRTSQTSATASVSITGTYYDGEGLQNLLTRALTLSYTETGGTAQTLSTFTITESTDSSTHITTFTATGSLSGLDYKKEINFTATITDKVGKTGTKSGSTTRGLSVYDAYTTSSGTNIFNVNGSLFQNGEPISGSGTVTSVIAGTGLSGGTITSTGTIALKSSSSSEIGGLKVRLSGTTLYIRNDGSDA